MSLFADSHEPLPAKVETRMLHRRTRHGVVELDNVDATVGYFEVPRDLISDPSRYRRAHAREIVENDVTTVRSSPYPHLDAAHHPTRRKMLKELKKDLLQVRIAGGLPGIGSPLLDRLQLRHNLRLRPSRMPRMHGLPPSRPGLG